MSQVLAQRIFDKSLQLLEQRLNIRIKSAVLIIESDFGQYSFESNVKDLGILTMVSKYFHQKLVRVLTRNTVSGGIVPCDLCMGNGEALLNGSLVTCGKCRGGGEVVRMLNAPEITGQIDLSN